MKKSILCCLLVLFGTVLFVNNSEGCAAEKALTVKHFSYSVFINSKDEAIPIKNADVEICYFDNGVRKTIQKGFVTDENGSIDNINVMVPEEVSRVYFKYSLSNSETGKLVNANGVTYQPFNSILIPSNRIIEYDSVRAIDTGNGEESTTFNYRAIQVWNIYQAMVKENNESLQTALDVFPELRSGFEYSFKPINVLYEYKHKRTDGPAFASSLTGVGEIKKNTPYISLPHIDALNNYNSAQLDEWFKINLAHEWAHWAMYLAIGKLIGGNYSGHSGYNENVAMSYKEGWAVFHANRYPYGYDWNWHLDNSMQISDTVETSGRLEKCYGKSTNWTVNSVLRDIYDMESPREPEDQYDIAKDWKSDVGSADREYRKKLSTGLMYIVMAKSKATTLEEFITFMQENGFVKDKIRFNIILVLNGVDHLGRFMMDKEGNRISY